MQTLTHVVGRILFGIPFVVFGLFHFINAGVLVSSVPGYLPFPLVLVYITGAAMVLAGASIISGKKVRTACLLLALLLLIFIVLVDIPGLPNQLSVGALLKDLALLGGALTLAGNYVD
ncbi:MAG: DoxX family membrane protein [Leptospirales bacterium]|nr:DoxX family membrane protein [Leptospirales bacterium]